MRLPLGKFFGTTWKVATPNLLGCWGGHAAAPNFRSTVMPHSSSSHSGDIEPIPVLLAPSAELKRSCIHPCGQLQLSRPSSNSVAESGSWRKGTPPIGVSAFAQNVVCHADNRRRILQFVQGERLISREFRAS